ncbi:MAG: glycosyltransferase [Acidobacteriota bacterium]
MLARILLWLLFLPLQAILIGFLAAVETLRFLWHSIIPGSGKQSSTPRNAEFCSIVIVTWNGRHLLEESLPALMKALEFTEKEHEIIVVDNGSQDDSLSWLQSAYPKIRVIALPDNLGFGEANNRGAQEARHDIVVLLNNDMIVAEDFLPPLLEGFSDPQVFAVSSQILFPKDKRREETGNTQARFERGYLHLSHEPVQRCYYSRKYLPVLWAGGGSSAFDCRRFLELGGFAALFSPCYFEDTDISYRAWRRGWKVLLAAHSRVLHKHRSSSSTRFGASQIEQLVEERKLWYLWRNFQLGTLLPHLLLFPLNLSKYLSPGNYLRALRRFPQALSDRLKEPARTVSDRELQDWIRRPLSYLDRFQPQRILSARVGEEGGSLRILIVSAYLPHLGYHGGAGRVFQLLRQVSRHHRITLVTFIETQKEFEELEQITPYCARIDTVFRNSFTPVSPFPYEPFEEFNCPAMKTKLEELLAEEDFDLVHFEWPQMAQYAELFPHTPKLMTEIEVNYVAHRSLVSVEPRLLFKFKKLYNSYQTFYRELEMCGKVDRVVCVTDNDRDYLHGYVGNEKLRIVNTGVDTQFYALNGASDKGALEPNRHAIAFIGAFRHEPNVDAMLYFTEQIFPLILKEQPLTRLCIVGSAPPACIQELGQNPNITVTGFVPDLRDYYQQAQVVVVPLRTGVGIRGKILEAWAAGKAVVATPLACQGLNVAHGENVVLASSPEEFALWTVALLRDPEFCRKMGRAGRETVERYYDWNILGERMLEVYRELAAERVPSSKFQFPSGGFSGKT